MDCVDLCSDIPSVCGDLLLCDLPFLNENEKNTTPSFVVIGRVW